MKLDAIITTCSPSTRAAKQATTSTPIVMAAVSDPVGQGFIASLARPGRNVTDNKGLDAKVVSAVDLAPDMPGYQLRLRTITVEAAGVAGLHSHKDRPELVYILEGTLTELREGGYMKQYKPGDVITGSRDVTHWAENRGTGKVVFVGVDIVKP